MNAKPYDVVAFGATSFVGKLLCRYFAGHFKSGELKWAAAGRSIEKLELMRRSLETDAEIPLIIADARDERSLAAMCAQTGVVVSTVGPYALYGEALVKVCAELGTDYCDLSGEVQWIRRMLDRYEKTASKTGARIVHCCGFDSVPSDLGFISFKSERSSGLGAIARMLRCASKPYVAAFPEAPLQASSMSPRKQRKIQPSDESCETPICFAQGIISRKLVKRASADRNTTAISKPGLLPSLWRALTLGLCIGPARS